MTRISDWCEATWLEVEFRPYLPPPLGHHCGWTGLGVSLSPQQALRGPVGEDPHSNTRHGRNRTLRPEPMRTPCPLTLCLVSRDWAATGQVRGVPRRQEPLGLNSSQVTHGATRPSPLPGPQFPTLNHARQLPLGQEPSLLPVPSIARAGAPMTATSFPSPNF